MKIKLTKTYMHIVLGVPPPHSPSPPIRNAEIDIGIFLYVLMVDDSNSINELHSHPFPFPDSTEASPLLSRDTFVSPLLPSLHILEKTYDPSLSVIG